MVGKSFPLRTASVHKRARVSTTNRLSAAGPIPNPRLNPAVQPLSNFANPLFRSLCNHFADAIANDWIIEHWIEFVGRKRLLRLRNRMTARTITVRFLG